MFVSPKYLDRFAIKFADDATLLALSPEETELRGIERTGSTGIALDAPPGGEYPEVIGILYVDTNPDDSESWELDGSKRKTFVTIPNHPVGYLFEGLILQTDLQKWFRHKFSIPTVIFESPSFKRQREEAEAATAEAAQAANSNEPTQVAE